MGKIIQPKNKFNVPVCSICGKRVVDSKNENICIGVYINTEDPGLADIQERAWMKEQVGDYKLGKPYYVCIACYLEALGIPKEEQDEDITT